VDVPVEEVTTSVKPSTWDRIKANPKKALT